MHNTQGSRKVSNVPRETPQTITVVSMILYVTFVIAGGGVSPVSAQTTEVTPFSLLPPGARALGMGGAFTAVADDATASVTNPAGLMQLDKQELSAQVRHERLDGTVGYLYKNVILDKTLVARRTRPSFASYVRPVRGMRLAIYYAEPIAYDFSVSAQFRVSDCFGTVCILRRYEAVSEARHRQDRRLGLSWAGRPFGWLTVGLGAERYSQKQQRNREIRLSLTSGGVPYGLLRDEVSVDDAVLGLRAGLLVRLGSKATLGASFSHQPGSGLHSRSSHSDGRSGNDWYREESAVLTLGLAWKPTAQLVISSEAYFDGRADHSSGSTTTTSSGSSSSQAAQYGSLSALRGGAEYTFRLFGLRAAVRGGAFREFYPYDLDAALPYDAKSFFLAPYRVTHLTGGIGVAVGTRGQIDVGLGTARGKQEAIASFALRF